MSKDAEALAASVRQRLYNRAKDTNRPFDELFLYFAMERFLYRFGKSRHKDKAVLKGALMFVVWQAPQSRATRDIDLLGRMENAVDKIVAMVKEICRVEVEPDGVTFDSESVTGVRIKEDADYEGVRIRFLGHLGQARAPMQIDFGFGDAVVPKPMEIDYPTILEMPHPRLKGYPKETVVAEKFQAMVQLGMVNSRMKDFYDIWLLARQFDFDGESLHKAVVTTFTTRNTVFTPDIADFFMEFGSNAEKHSQWTAFVNRNKIIDAPGRLEAVVSDLGKFLLPIAGAASDASAFPQIWNAPGSWREKALST